MPRTRIAQQTHAIGSTVSAKWPSSNTYYHAFVIDITDDEKYTVKFQDGSTYMIPYRFVKPLTTTPRPRRRSLSRTRRLKEVSDDDEDDDDDDEDYVVKNKTASARKSTPKRSVSRSRSRSKSPGRLPSRSKSPGRSPSRSQSRRSAVLSKTVDSVADESNSFVKAVVLIQQTKIRENSPSVEATTTTISSSSSTRVGVRHNVNGSSTPNKREKITATEESKTEKITAREESKTEKITAREESKTEKITARESKTTVETSIGTRTRSRTQKTVVYRQIMEQHRLTDSTPQTSPDVHEREYFGACGVSVLMLLTPVFVYCLYIACNSASCTLSTLPRIPSYIEAYYDWRAIALMSGWLLFQAIVYMLPISRVIEGSTLTDGSTIKYRLNGLLSLVISCATLAAMVHYDLSVTLVYDLFGQLVVTGTAISFFIALLLYIKSFNITSDKCSITGNTGNFIYDYFMGRELNPQFLRHDLKFFFELYPSLIGWNMLNLIMLVRDMKSNDGIPSTPLLALVVLQTLYVLDSLWWEEYMVLSFDILHEGFGWMLLFGNLVWMPFTYSLPTRFLADHRDVVLPNWAICGIVTLGLVGMFISRASNNQKLVVRRYPDHPAAHRLQFLEIQSGKRLLVDGWWSFVRHPNYLGDIITSLSWSLLCGFDYALPHYLFVFIFFFLCHRAVRDERKCSATYGSAWNKYSSQVRSRIIPGIY